jgi:hypothetical protein
MCCWRSSSRIGRTARHRRPRRPLGPDGRLRIRRRAMTIRRRSRRRPRQEAARSPSGRWAEASGPEQPHAHPQQQQHIRNGRPPAAATPRSRTVDLTPERDLQQSFQRTPADKTDASDSTKRPGSAKSAQAGALRSWKKLLPLFAKHAGAGIWVAWKDWSRSRSVGSRPPRSMTCASTSAADGAGPLLRSRRSTCRSSGGRSRVRRGELYPTDPSHRPPEFGGGQVGERADWRQTVEALFRRSIGGGAAPPSATSTRAGGGRSPRDAAQRRT